MEMARNNAAQEFSQKSNRTGKELAGLDQLPEIEEDQETDASQEPEEQLSFQA
ncbi:MAG: hypothetical protein RR528_03955 [Angelakisella sp.]